MQRVTEDVLRRLGSLEPSTDGSNLTLMDDLATASALRTFLILTQQPKLLIDAGWSPETIFWSRYYWFRRYLYLRSILVGADAGLEQQAVQILETPFPQCEPDWSQLESIESAAATK